MTPYDAGKWTHKANFYDYIERLNARTGGGQLGPREYMLMLEDFLQNNREDLGEFLRDDFRESQDALFARLLPIEYTDNERFEGRNLIFKPLYIGDTARRAIAPEFAVTFETYASAMNFYNLAAILDLKMLRKMGPQYFESVKNVVWTRTTYALKIAAYLGYVHRASWYRTAEQTHPGPGAGGNAIGPNGVVSAGMAPKTVEEELDDAPRLFCAPDKYPRGFELLRERVDGIFRQADGRRARYAIVSERDINRVVYMDETNLDPYYAGPGGRALTNEPHRLPRTHLGIDFVVIPRLAPRLHGTPTENIYAPIVSVGAMWHTLPAFLDVPPAEYHSRMAETRACSRQTDDWDVYDVADALRAHPAWVPLNADVVRGADAAPPPNVRDDDEGFPNTEFLDALAKAIGPKNDWTQRHDHVRTTYKGREWEVHQLLRYNPGHTVALDEDDTHVQHLTPILFAGELDARLVDDEFLEYSAATLRAALLRNMATRTDEGVVDTSEAEAAIAEFSNEVGANLGYVTQLMKNAVAITHANPLLFQYQINGSGDIALTPDNPLNTIIRILRSNEYIARGVIPAVADEATGELSGDPKAQFTDSAYATALNQFSAYKDVPAEVARVLAHMEAYPVHGDVRAQATKSADGKFFLPTDPEQTDFVRRYKAALACDPLTRLARLLTLFQPLTHQARLRAREHHVAPVLFATMARHAEAQRTSAWVWNTDTPAGNMMVTREKFPEIVNENSTTDMLKFQVGAGAGPLVRNTQEFFVQANACAGEDMGGCGRHFVGEGVSYRDTRAWDDRVLRRVSDGVLMQNHCIVPLILPANTARLILSGHGKRHFDLIGYWSENKYRHRVARNSTSFPRTGAHAPMYPDQAGTVLAYRLESPEPLIEDSHLNFIEIANLQRFNTTCSQQNHLVYSHASESGFRELQSYHMWGTRRPGLRPRETGCVKHTIEETQPGGLPRFL